MKVSFNWLKQYAEFDWSPEELAERLTVLGLEVEAVQRLAGSLHPRWGDLILLPW